MKYLETFSIFERKNKIEPFYHIFRTLPKTVDVKIVKWMIKNWGDIFKKSPYGYSYYNFDKTWYYNEDKGLRLSDHWNFISDNEIHCKINKKIKNNTEWTIARYDKETDTYLIEISLPFNFSKENEISINKIKNKFKFKEKIIKEKIGNPNLDILKTYIKNDNLYAIIKKYEFGKFSKEYKGKVIKLKNSSINIEFNDNIEIFKNNIFRNSDIYFYDKNWNYLKINKKHKIRYIN